MDDARYIYYQDVKEKKRIARGSQHKVRGGGRKVKMPTDYLTRKEKSALNGELISYNLNSPMKWREFNKMPEDIQEEYITGLVRKYNANASWLGEMFGVGRATVTRWGATHNITFRAMSGKQIRNIKPKWEAFLNAHEWKPEDKPELKPEDKPEAITDIEAPTDIAKLISMLAGTGAKLTIEVIL